MAHGDTSARLSYVAAALTVQNTMVMMLHTRQTYHALYLQRYIVVRKRNNCCHGNTTIVPFLLLLAYVHLSAI